jgi:hypothetical protein
MTQKRPTRLDNPKVIAGFFREALFFSRRIKFDFENISGELALHEIEEPHARVKSGERYLVLGPVMVGSNILKEALRARPANIKFQCSFPHFVASWEGIGEFSQSDLFKTLIPNQIQISNQRSKFRLTPAASRGMRASVLVQSGGIHTEGLLEIENISSNGFGGILQLRRGIQVDSSAKVIGKLLIDQGSLSIHGRITHATLIDERSNSQVSYRIGLNVSEALDEPKTEPAMDRRQAARVRTDIQLQLRSPFNPNHEIQIRVDDASVCGFGAALQNHDDLHLLPVGCGVQIENSTLVAEVVAFEKNYYHFQFIEGTSEDRVFWLKRLARFQNPGTVTSSAVGKELIDLFCESGALASGFLRAQSNSADDMAEELSAESIHEPWIHRWIEKTDEGKNRGHISAVRIADNTWMLADLAGSSIENQKLSKEFVPEFFTSFMEFSLSTNPCPRILLSWNSGHKYWVDFETHLRGTRFVQGMVSTRYFRFQKNDPLDDHAGEVFQIKAGDHDFIENILSRSSLGSSKSILQALDFAIDRFGSPDLRRVIRKYEKAFDREYLRIVVGKSEWLAVLSSFPLGSSFNRTPDVAWLFRLTTESNEVDLRTALTSLRRHSIRRGVSIPGCLEVIGESESSKSAGLKTMTWSLVHPEALRWFKK